MFRLILKFLGGALLVTLFMPFLSTNAMVCVALYLLFFVPTQSDLMELGGKMYQYFVNGVETTVTPEDHERYMAAIDTLLGSELKTFTVAVFVLGFVSVFLSHKGFKKRLLFTVLPFSLFVHFAIFPFVIKRLLGKKEDEKSPVTKAPESLTLQTQSGELVVNNPFRGTLVVGGNGAGKSESVVVPYLSEFLKANFCGIMYDFKYPSLANDLDALAEGKTTLPHYRLDFDNPLQSNQVNPLNPDYLKNSSIAREAALSLVSNLMKESIEQPTFWSRSVTDVLTACIWFLKREKPEFCTLPHVCHLVNSDFKKVIKLLSSNDETAVMINSVRTAADGDAGNQLAGVLSSLQSMIAQINTPEIMYIFSGNDFDLNINDPANPKLLTVGTNSSTPEVYAPLCSLVIKMSLKLMNQADKHHSFLLLDEAPTVYIPDLQQVPNTGRSNKIATVLTCQDLEQWTDGYGKVKSDVLFGACNNHFYGSVSSIQTAEKLSKQFGKEDKIFHATNTSRQNTSFMKKSHGKTEVIQEREIIKASSFKNFQVGEFAGHLVEGEGFFRERFKMIERPPFQQEPINKEDQILQRYQESRKQVAEILS